MESLKKVCVACGFAPASHSALWMTNSSDVLSLYFRDLGKAKLVRVLSRIGEWLVSRIFSAALAVGTACGIVSYNEERTRACSNRSKLIWDEACKRGIRMRQLCLFGAPTDTFEIIFKGKRYFFQSIPIPPEREKYERLDMDDKVAFKEMLRAHALPVPKSYSVHSLQRAHSLLTELGTICIKPQSGSNGRHTYPFIRAKEDVAPALKSAKEICIFASIEEHLEGNLCRATCVDGVLVGFLESLYPTVVGDGVSTISSLIEKANETRPSGVAPIDINATHEGYIRRRGYTLSDILPEGVALPLTYRAGASSGGRNREYGRGIHPSFIPRIEEAAQKVGLSVVGFDLIIPDPHKPEHEQRWGFIEANSLPWIDLHQTPLYGTPVNLAPYVWDLWIKYT